MDLMPYIERLDKAWKKTIRQIENDVMQHKELGLTAPQFHLLLYIYKNGTSNIGVLADAMEVKPSAITVMLDRLVQNGFVERRHDENDRRAVLVSLTDYGNEMLLKGRQKSLEIMKWYLGQLKPEEVETLTRIVERLSDAEKPPWFKK